MIKDSVSYIQKNLNLIKPEIAIILGTGLGEFTENLENVKSIPYKDIPGFPESTVQGHKGELLKGYLENKEILCLNGRFHIYEGHKAADISKVIHILKELGVKKLIVTNAAGSLRREFKPGQLVLIKDHINFSFENPLIGPNDERYGVRFPAMSEAYSKKMQQKCQNLATQLGIDLQEGIYMMVKGPNFETAAEAKAFALLGADIIGMSTVLEVIAAVHCSMEVLGVSVITNYTAGVINIRSTHEETLEEAGKAAKQLNQLLIAFIKTEE